MHLKLFEDYAFCFIADMHKHKIWPALYAQKSPK